MSQNNLFAEENLNFSKDGSRAEELNRKKIRRTVKHAFEYVNQLYETVLDERGNLCFATFDGLDFKKLPFLRVERDDFIEEVAPAPLSNQPYRPYVFSNGWRSLKTVRDVYEEVKSFIKQHVDAPEEYITIASLDVVLTYFQEKINTTHYLYLVGDNESGKSQFLFSMALLSYRGFYACDVSAPNLFEFLGTDDNIVVGSIFEDEAENLADDGDRRRLYKTGYKRGAKVPRILLNKERGMRIQRFYNAFSFKASCGEEIPHGRYSKGLMERFLILRMVEGYPEKDTIDDSDLREADRIKSELLALRLFYWATPLPEVDYTVQVGAEKVVLKGRLKELFEGVLRIAKFLDVEDEAKKAIAFFIREKFQEREASLEGLIAKAVYEAVKDRLETPSETLEAEFEEIFQNLADVSDGTIEADKIISNNFNFPITKQLVGRRLSDVFQAETKTVEKKRLRVFKKDVLLRLLRKYHILKLDSDFQEKCDSTVFQQNRLTEKPISAVVRGGEEYGKTEKKGDAGGLPKDGKIYSKMSRNNSSTTPDISKSVYRFQVDSERDRKILPLHSFQNESRHFSKTSNISKDEAISKEEQILKPSKEGLKNAEVVGDALEGYVCVFCGRSADKLVKIKGVQEAVCLTCLLNAYPLDGLIQQAKNLFEQMKIVDTGLAEKISFLERLREVTPFADELYKLLLKKGLFIEVREKWVKSVY